MTTRQSTAASTAPGASGAETLTITDNRTGSSYELPIADGTIRATDLRQIKVDEDDFGLMTYDPAFMNTASCRSAITYLDGDAGILRYRGYPIEQLAERSSFLEVAYLLVFGDLPTQEQLDGWVHDITHHTFVHENVKGLMQGFRYDAHPMGMLQSSVGALSTFYPEAKDIGDPDNRYLQIVRLIAKMPTLGAWAFRHTSGKPYVYPENELSYSANFLSMLFTIGGKRYEPDPRIERALDVLFILHADHEQNCSTSAVRSVGSSQVDPYSAVAAGIAALYGPLHGGANEAVLRMLRRIESTDNIPGFIEGVKGGEERLMGFGHRVYKNYDPRATIIKKACDDVFAVTGVNPLLSIAVELERIALEDEYFVSRKLYPNVDFYSGLIYEALGMPADMFTVLFAIGRTPGWVAQWAEMLQDKEQKISRPAPDLRGLRRARLRGDRLAVVSDGLEEGDELRQLVVVQAVPEPLQHLAPARQRLLGHPEALTGDVGLHHPPVAGVWQALDEPAPLQAVDELGDIGAGDAELVAQRVQARPPVGAAAEHLEDLELGVREPEVDRVALEPARGGARRPVEGLARPARELRARRRRGRCRVHHVSRYHRRVAARQGRPAVSVGGVTDPQEQVRQALRDLGQELSKAMEQAQRLARQVGDDLSRLVSEPPRKRAKRAPGAPTELIRELARLRDEGLVTEEEFQAKKAELLARL